MSSTRERQKQGHGLAHRRVVGVAIATILAVAVGCKDKNPVGPGDALPTLNSLWPNADSTAWTYDLTQRTWDTTFPDTLFGTPQEVPPVPSMQAVEALLAGHATGDDVQEERGRYHLEFNGMITTQSGVTAQNLEETVSDVPPAVAQAGAAPLSPFLGRLYRARPDLRGRILEGVRERTGGELEAVHGRAGLGTAPTRAAAARGARDDLEAELAAIASDPLFLSGGAWKKTAEWIGAYGDLDTLLAWKYLDADLAVGSTFTLQLVPSLADDVFLHARILDRGTVDGFENAITCLYVVDFGVAFASDATGTVTGYYRTFDYGTVVYAPEVGPVSSYERKGVEPLDPVTPGFGDVSLSLVKPVVRR